MPQMQNLVLTDRAATPVNHTFTPREKQGNVGTVVEAGASPIADNKFSIALSKTAGGRYKTTIKAVFPVVQTQVINGISTPAVVRVAYCDIAFSFDGSSTEQERKDAVGMIMSSLDPSKVLVNDTVIKLQGLY